MERVLITGAAGTIGCSLRRSLRGVYPSIRLSDRIRPADLAAGDEFIEADLADLAAVEKAVSGVQGILHLGGISGESDWPSILESNIVGTYNLFEAARHQGVERVVFASSNHAIGFYRRTRRIGSDVLPRPDSRYGVSKAFGESLGALYADKYGLRVLCLRIGNFGDKPVDKRRLSIWISPEDLTQLVRIGLEHPELRYAVAYGVSDNERSWWDNEAAHRLGYRPRSRAEDYVGEALAAQDKLPPDPIGDLFQGGTFASAEFVGESEGRGG